MVKWKKIKNFKVLVLATYCRCGSTALCEYYSKKYNIGNDDEMFFYDCNPDDVQKTLEGQIGYVIKITSAQWEKSMKESHREYIKNVFSHHNAKVVLLYRKNIPEQLLSLAHCNYSSHWHNKNNFIEDKEIKVLVNEAMNLYSDFITNIKYTNKLIKEIVPHEILEYADVLKLPKQTFKKNRRNISYKKALEQLNSKFKKQLVYESKYFKIV